nr:cupin domain-containing protein [Novosphingobium sediminicola]
MRAGQKIKWCACGLSKRQPFCDSVSHEGTGFEPIEYVAKEAEEVLLCGCKQTKTGPFCDGEHSNLPGGYKDEEEPQNTTLVEADADGFARLNTPCYVVSPPAMSDAYALARLVAPETGAQFQSQFYLTLPAGSSPVLASDVGDVVLWVRHGAGVVEIEGRSFPFDGSCGVYIRRGEGFRLTASSPLAVYVSECPGGNNLSERAEMGANFDEAWPERIAKIDEDARQAMGPRYFQVLLDDRHGLRNTAQFIGHIPRSKAEMHRHLYEEALIIISGTGVIWNDDFRAPVKAGDVIFFPRKIRHSLQCTCDEGLDVLGLIHPGTNPGINYE